MEKIILEIKEKVILRDFLKLNLAKKQYKRLKYRQAIFKINDREVFPYQEVTPGILEISYEEERLSEWDFVDIPLKIVFEDEHYLVINKEPGILTIPTKAEPISVYQQVLTYFQDKTRHISILNRLDKETSGLMLIAKDRYSANLLEPVKGKIERHYHALVSGHLEGRGTIDKPIGKEENSKKRIICENGQIAITHYESLCYNGHNTLVELRLETGRTHQIRVHLASIGYPIVGDALYGKEKFKRMCLESVYLKFTNPYDHQVYEFKIKEDFYD